MLVGLLALALGAALGEWWRIEEGLENLGDRLKRRFRGSGRFTEGFVAASLLFCVGPLALLGSIQNPHEERPLHHQRNRRALGNHSKQAYRMVGDVTPSVAIQIPSCIAVPPVAIHLRPSVAAVDRHIEGVSLEAISFQHHSRTG